MEKVKETIIKVFKKYNKYIITVCCIMMLFISGIIVNAKNNNTDEPISINQNVNNQITVEIIGDVAYPGKYQVNQGTKVEYLLKLAGYDFNNGLNLLVNKNSLLEHNDVINVPETKNNPNRININTASIEELKQLKSIGETKATNIVLYRKLNGSYKTVEDLLVVDGITSKILLDIIDEIKLS